ncbi:MAG TPA: hypothetical protein VJO16_15650 [Candidatus Acidoferrum sp.]|nr:hypothetical protein [Candidatus Acidoferrum sp.]
MSGSDAEKRGTGVYREMRVAHIRERKDAEYLEVMFLESARIYKLFKENPAYNEIVGELRAAVGKKSAVQVRCVVAESDVIEEVRAHT